MYMICAQVRARPMRHVSSGKVLRLREIDCITAWIGWDGVARVFDELVMARGEQSLAEYYWMDSCSHTSGDERYALPVLDCRMSRHGDQLPAYIEHCHPWAQPGRDSTRWYRIYSWQASPNSSINAVQNSRWARATWSRWALTRTRDPRDWFGHEQFPVTLAQPMAGGEGCFWAGRAGRAGWSASKPGLKMSAAEARFGTRDRQGLSQGTAADIMDP
ncbi:hypothetical protein DM02DRAFT_633002 [Periconia macrospinosa]|uniref:Uncharacterized protein n=1 Tax=Periconia macrospinosa TaxID=97972 RepID=A0A2V1DDS8_9PLEO|nr:hypothetical protein DM02DRAFT_633002 [Periconia macrospinosa]